MRTTIFCLVPVILLGLFGLASPSSVLAETVPSADDGSLRYLLYVQDVVQYQGGPAVVDETFIFRDGLTVVVRNSDYAATEVYRTVASQESTQALKMLLSENQVGAQVGRCNVAGVPLLLPLPQDPAKRQTLISWFGLQGSRTNHLLLGHEDPPATETAAFDHPCSQEVTRIADAALSFLRTTLAAAGSAQPAGGDLLFEVRNHYLDDTRCGQDSFDDDYFIFRDGLFLRRAETSEGAFSFSRSLVIDGTRKELFDALNENKVGFQAGECHTWFFLPFLVAGSCLDYTWQSSATWFGAGHRKATILGTDATSAVCSGEQLAIQNVVTTAVRNSLAQPFATDASGRLPQP